MIEYIFEGRLKSTQKQDNKWAFTHKGEEDFVGTSSVYTTTKDLETLLQKFNFNEFETFIIKKSIL